MTDAQTPSDEQGDHPTHVCTDRAKYLQMADMGCLFCKIDEQERELAAANQKLEDERIAREHDALKRIIESSGLPELLESHRQQYADKCFELIAAKAEADALREDAERYRWLRERLYGFDADFCENGLGVVFKFPEDSRIGVGQALDAAIDAARKG